MPDILYSSSDLSKAFRLHLSAINGAIKPADSKVLWQDIAVRYSESARAYHNLRHLEQLFAQFKVIEKWLYEPNIIALALYYHDVIYDPTRADNELKSAEYAIDKLKDYLTQTQCQRIYELIMMTAKHQLDNKTDSDGAYLLDMDLSILGSHESDYQQYAAAVRQEYAHVSAANYRTGRTAILQGLLAHSRLYITDYYYQRLEALARQNIKREIILLAA
ncbi:hypothetical protein [uncultured Psychrobacter sp.]|uniref:HD domain-containing protein n=1 Tax=uncultured Psychrobacter sp. TaxID=259303 RepID=UPI003457BB9B